MAAALLIAVPGCVWLTEKPWWLTDNRWWQPGWPPREDFAHRVRCAPAPPPWTQNLDDPPSMSATRRRLPVEKSPQSRAVEVPPAATLSKETKPTPDQAELPLDQVPTAVRVGERPGRVKSPFPPYGDLDVSGMSSGSLARDPVSGKLFRVP